MNVVAFDTETFLLGPGAVAPKLVCASFAAFDPGSGSVGGLLYSTADAELEPLIYNLLTDDETLLVFHNAAYDLTVVASHWPYMLPAIFAKLDKGLVTDTKIREKLLNLSTTGRVEKRYFPDGSNERIKYSLSALVFQYTGRDRSGEKTGDDIWRMNYFTLDGVPAADFPKDAQTYALDDALDTYEVYMLQAEAVQGEHGPGSVTTETFQTAADFALKLQTCWGFAVDRAAVDEVQAMLEEELSPEKLDILIREKILVPGEPPRPYANGAKHPDGTPKMTKGTDPSIKAGNLREHVRAVCLKNGLEVRMTNPSNKFPEGQIAIGKEVYEELAPLDPLLGQYQHRAILNKLVTDYMPKLRDTDVVHPDYDILKETGRTSSFAGNLYPSCNIQQMDPRVRHCFVARPGHILVSVDYSGIELAVFAQMTYKLFGESVHRDKLQEGKDLHAYLGAQLAHRLDPFFKGYPEGGADNNYGRFMAYKATDPARFKHWRTFAKPVGLGFPGGMGAKTMMNTAKRDYGIDMTLEEAEEAKKTWLETYPEAKRWFKHIRHECQDPANTGTDPKTGDTWDLYAYYTPMGMYRAGADYCAACNGEGLQSPAAEGAKAAGFLLARACYDETRESILFNCRPVAFIHDEFIVEVPDDEDRGARAAEVAQVMEYAMGQVLPDVPVKTEASLMYRWSKEAEPVFAPDGTLTVWEPVA